MDNKYNHDYFERGIEAGVSCYSNYRWMPEFTIPLCFRIIEYLGIRRSDLLLDFGCAKGYIVKGFRLLYREAYGVDVSEYAISKAPEEIKQFLYLINSIDEIPLQNDKKYDWFIAKDVLEHIDYSEIDNILEKIRKSSKRAFIIVPLGNGENYYIPAYEMDITHKIRENLFWWKNKFESNKFKVIDEKYRIINIKENWSGYEYGNGFFVLE
jgi:SAM-dependent methyltransferase